MASHAAPVYLTRRQVRNVDRIAVERYRIPGIVLMENAAVGAAAVAMEMLAAHGASTALILCGGGNNGGDGLAIARHLHNRGVAVRIALCVDPARYQGDALINWRIAEAMNLPAVPADPDALAAARDVLVIDAVFGTGLAQPPRPPFDRIVDAVVRSAQPVLAIDLPSGLDCDSGAPLGPCIRADRTVTFVALKAGFANPASRAWTGDVIVACIGCPPAAITEALA